MSEPIESDHRRTDVQEDIRSIEAHLGHWFPRPARVGVGTIGDLPILPEEAALTARAILRRQQEFATGRWLSRQGLRSLGFPDTAIGMGRLRNPVWPDGVLGTISHDGGLCATVVMRQPERDVTGIGMDLVHLSERTGRMEALLPMFAASGDERDAMSAFAVPVEPALLLFSLKEAVVKAVSLRHGVFLDLRSIRIGAGNGPGLVVGGERIEARMHATRTAQYVVTAVTVA